MTRSTWKPALETLEDRAALSASSYLQPVAAFGPAQTQGVTDKEIIEALNKGTQFKAPTGGTQSQGIIAILIGL
jgi:hypothetical protein